MLDNSELIWSNMNAFKSSSRDATQKQIPETDNH